MNSIFIKELAQLSAYRRRRGLRRSTKQDQVVKAFLKIEKHIDTQGLYDLLRVQGQRIGYATVWRALRLLAEAGLARPVKLGGREVRFEHLLGHPHHDHLVCLHCGRVIEVQEPRLEDLQDRVAARHRFRAQDHSLTIYGLCRRCQ